MVRAFAATARIGGVFWAQSGRLPLRLAIACGIAGWFLWFLAGRLDGYDISGLPGALMALPAWRWGAAVLAAAVSFAAIGAYDVVAGREAAMPIRAGAVFRAGLCATALSQLVGLGLATGTLVRARLLRSSGMDIWAASQQTLRVTIGFLVVGAVWGALALVAHGQSWLLAIAASAGLAAFLTICILRPLHIPRVWGVLPRLKTLRDFAVLVPVDLIFAGLCFALLLPENTSLSTGSAVILISLAVLGATVSGVPGGVGLFEVILIGLAPPASLADIIPALVAFRVIYYLLPGLGAALWLLREELWPRADRPLAPVKPLDQSRLSGILKSAPRAEMGLVRAPGFQMLSHGEAALACQRQGNSLIGFGDCLGGAPAGVLALLRRMARAEGRFPALYKCSADTAAAARRAGFRTYKIGAEAVIPAGVFLMEGRAYSGLRRKLRQAARAGVTVAEAGGASLPLADMAAVSLAWARASGGERRFSTGQFDPVDLTHRRVFLAHRAGRLIGFVSFFQTDRETALDLIRHHPEAPAGTIYALIAEAIAAEAAGAGRRISLSAVPFAGLEQETGLVGWICRRIGALGGRWHNAAGLRQFKSAFRPDWRPLYLAVDGPLSAAIVGVDCWALIRPAPERQGRARVKRISFRRKPA